LFGGRINAGGNIGNRPERTKMKRKMKIQKTRDQERKGFRWSSFRNFKGGGAREIGERSYKFGQFGQRVMWGERNTKKPISVMWVYL